MVWMSTLCGAVIKMNSASLEQNFLTLPIFVLKTGPDCWYPCKQRILNLFFSSFSFFPLFSSLPFLSLFSLFPFFSCFPSGIISPSFFSMTPKHKSIIEKQSRKVFAFSHSSFFNALRLCLREALVPDLNFRGK